MNAPTITTDNKDKDNTRDADQRILRSRFWFLAAVSAFLIITFVYHLPLRFLHQATGDTGHGMMANGMAADGHMRDVPSTAVLEKLPLKNPLNRTGSLAFVMAEDGYKEFRLEADEFRWEYAPGKWVHVWGYNNQIPGPEIRVIEGDKVRVIVKNNLPDATTVHWHGLDVPWQMDGVAGVTQEAIQPGKEFRYEFTALPAGTRFYHTHGYSHETSAQQLDMGLSGAFIVEEFRQQRITPKNATEYDRDYTLILDEWEILAGGANTAVGHVHGSGAMGAIPDFNTFTINGRIFPYTDILPIQKGERALVRFINVGTAASHPMHLHGHSFRVVARDGFTLAAAAQEEHNTITINPGETLDILVDANNPGPWLLHCHHVHHAAAGMITLFKYEGYEPIRPLQ